MIFILATFAFTDRKMRHILFMSDFAWVITFCHTKKVIKEETTFHVLESKEYIIYKGRGSMSSERGLQERE